MSINVFIKNCCILDLDGTICECGHRLHHLDSEPTDWDSFFGAMHLDTVIEPVALIARTLHDAGVKILIVTARPDDKNYRQVTSDWLDANSIRYDKIYMRKADDRRRDDVVKSEILAQILEDGYDPILAIDDKANIAEMYRSFGIVTLQCAPDEPKRNKYEGQTLLHVLVGPSGAGKSTYCAKHYKPFDIVSTDQIRRDLFGDHQLGHRPEELARTWAFAHGLIKTRLENGIFTVLDATNLKSKDRMAVLKQVPKGIVVQYVILDRDYDEKIKDRGWRPIELIDKHHRQFKSNIKEILAADHQANVFVLDKR